MILRTCASIVLSIWLSLAVLPSAMAEDQNVEVASAHAGAQRLKEIVDVAVAHSIKAFADRGLQSNQLAITLVDLRDRQRPAQASYRGDVKIYPAGVIKLFYLV